MISTYLISLHEAYVLAREKQKASKEIYNRILGLKEDMDPNDMLAQRKLINIIKELDDQVPARQLYCEVREMFRSEWAKEVKRVGRSHIIRNCDRTILMTLIQTGVI